MNSLLKSQRNRILFVIGVLAGCYAAMRSSRRAHARRFIQGVLEEIRRGA